MSNLNTSSNHSFTLEAQTPLNGFSQSFDGIEVSELMGHSLISMAMPNDQHSDLAKNIKSAYDTDLPEVGKFTISSVDNTRILRFQQDQCFVLFENEDVYKSVNAVNHIQEKTKHSAYLSDQSDSWAILKLSGKNVITALERVCPIDLNSSSHHSSHSSLQSQTFGPFSVTRTSMEYLSVIIMQTDENEYLLFSPRSSADSFLHMILTSIENVT